MKPEAPDSEGMLDRIRNWRLPVRYRVPPRNDLIAFALMALAFGLMVGLAIAPGWGNAGSAAPLIALPGNEQAAPETEDEAAAEEVADLQPPAGGETTTTADTTPDPVTTTTSTPAPIDTSADEPVEEEPVEETPSENYIDSPPAEQPADTEPESEPALTATVVGSAQNGYAVADSAGNLLYIHNSPTSSGSPKVGMKIGTDINPVDNGTFVQSGDLEKSGSATTSKLTGTVSFIDPDSGVISVSSRGVSIAVAAATAIEKSAEPPEIGSLVTGVVSFAAKKAAAPAPTDEEAKPLEGEEEEVEEPITIPTLTAKSIETTAGPFTQIELAGPVSWDSATRVLAIGADSFGVLNREIEIPVKPRLALKGIESDLVYAASADIGKQGALTLAGLSANFSLEAAADPKQAFGTHAR